MLGMIAMIIIETVEISVNSVELTFRVCGVWRYIYSVKLSPSSGHRVASGETVQWMIGGAAGGATTMRDGL